MLFSKILNLFEGKVKRQNIWDVTLLSRRTFTWADLIVIPVDKVLQLHSPSIECEVEISGELYIL